MKATSNNHHKTPVFIIGAPRSGTTFLTRVMNTFLDVHIARDGGTFLRFFKMLPEFGDLSREENLRQLVESLFQDHFFNIRLLERGLSLTIEAVLERFTGTTYTELVNWIMTEMAHQQGKSRWGIKRPSYALYVEDLVDMFPGAKILHIVRDGRDVAFSMRQARQSSFERNWYYAIKDWEYHVCEAREGGNRLPENQYMEVRYEDLMKAPVAEFEKIIHFMGETEENTKRLKQFTSKIQQMIKPGNYEKWRHQVPEYAVKIMEQAAGNTLEAFGYSLMFPHLANQPFNPVQKVWFFLDNIQGKIWSSSVKKSVVYRYHWLRTRWKLSG